VQQSRYSDQGKSKIWYQLKLLLLSVLNRKERDENIISKILPEGEGVYML